MTDTERKPKILVVDDDPKLRDLLRRYLGDNGFAVSVADGGQSMTRLWLRERFDALILDLMMPGEDGLQILRRLRASKDQTPVIMLTARGEEVDRIVGLELGADDYLGKPFNPRELLARIHAVLRRRPAGDQPGAPSLENEIVRFGEFELTDAEWEKFAAFLIKGTARDRKENTDSGDSGPWLYLYRENYDPQGQEFYFDSYGTLKEFERFCEGLADSGR